MAKAASTAARHRFGAVASTNLDAMYRVAFRMLHDHHQAEDAVQDALRKAWDRLDQFRADSELKPWLFKILSNTCLDHLRSRNRWSAHIDGSDTEPAEYPSGSPSPDKLTSDYQQIRTIEVAINALPAQYQVVIQLVVIEQFSYQEAAQALDLPIGTIRSRVSRARAQLAGTLKAQADIEPTETTQLRVVR
jgi:RNA polymerase sigma-70 factor (ECF subfamily)